MIFCFRSYWRLAYRNCRAAKLLRSSDFYSDFRPRIRRLRFPWLYSAFWNSDYRSYFKRLAIRWHKERGLYSREAEVARFRENLRVFARLQNENMAAVSPDTWTFFSQWTWVSNECIAFCFVWYEQSNDFCEIILYFVALYPFERWYAVLICRFKVSFPFTFAKKITIWRELAHSVIKSTITLCSGLSFRFVNNSAYCTDTS